MYTSSVCNYRQSVNNTLKEITNTDSTTRKYEEMTSDTLFGHVYIGSDNKEWYKAHSEASDAPVVLSVSLEQFPWFYHSIFNN